MPKRLRKGATVIDRGAYRIECNECGQHSHLYHLFMDFQLQCAEFISHLESETTRILIYFDDGGDTALDRKEIPDEALVHLEWMVSNNRAIKKQRLDNKSLESEQVGAYTKGGNGKQPSLFKDQ